MAQLFGTDGIRGKANVYPMTSEIALQVGKALAHVVAERCQKEDDRHKIVIGKDTRLSGYMFETALTSGIVAMGVDVLLVGPMPTPAVAHLTKSLNADAGIMLTASHNPSDDNGIKIIGPDGFKLSDDAEKEIEDLVLSKSINTDHITSEKIGKAYRIDDAKGRYIEFAKSSIRSMSLRGLTIVLDCANGAAYNSAPNIFRELGAKVIEMGTSPDGHNINKGCGAMNPELLQKLVQESNADVGIALDGDADRILVVDEKGKVVDGDHIIAIAALDLKQKGFLTNDKVAATVMANAGFHDAMKNAGIQVATTKVGDRYLIEEMRKQDIALGGEQSGHIIFLKYATTGDGVITALQLLRIMKESKKTMSELATCMETYPQVLINVPVKEKPDLESLKAQSVVEQSQEEGFRILVRYSGTEPVCRVMVEGKDEKKIQEKAQAIANAIREELS